MNNLPAYVSYDLLARVHLRPLVTFKERDWARYGGAGQDVPPRVPLGGRNRGRVALYSAPPRVPRDLGRGGTGREGKLGHLHGHVASVLSGRRRSEAVVGGSTSTGGGGGGQSLK